MDLNTFEPAFLIQIEGQALSADITGEITSFVFEDNEEELDVIELSVSNRHLRFVDDPLFQKGCVNDLSPSKKAVIKDIDYDFRKTATRGFGSKPTTRAFSWRAKRTRRSGRSPRSGWRRRERTEGRRGQLPSLLPRQGRRKVETFTGAGEPNASFPLTGPEIAQGSLRVVIGEQAWREVHHFQESGGADQHFQVETDGLDRTRILFGDAGLDAAAATISAPGSSRNFRVPSTRTASPSKASPIAPSVRATPHSPIR